MPLTVTHTSTNQNMINTEHEASSEDDASLNDDTEYVNKHKWQAATRKRKRSTKYQTNKKFQQIVTTNKYLPLAVEDHNENTNENNDNTRENRQIKDSKPPPIYIYGVNDYKAMTTTLAEVAEEETYHARAMANNTVRINPHTPDTYRKLVRYLRAENIIHHTYQLKNERAYRVVIRDLHYSIPLEEIKEELKTKGHNVRNIINVRHRISKDPLPLFFVDLEPQDNNKDIYDVQFLLNSKIRVEPPRKKTYIIQCTRCQEYGHSKTYCRKPYNCVKCGNPHDSRICKKTKDTPAKCVLCQGAHPANYKGCTIYQDLINLRSKDNKTTKHTIPQCLQSSTNINQPQQTTLPKRYQTTPPSYAHITAANINNPTTSNAIEDKFTHFLNEFKTMFNQLLHQNSMILSMLTTVINKLAQ